MRRLFCHSSSVFVGYCGCAAVFYHCLFLICFFVCFFGVAGPLSFVVFLRRFLYCKSYLLVYDLSLCVPHLPLFCVSGGLCVVIVTFPGYLHLCVLLIHSLTNNFSLDCFDSGINRLRVISVKKHIKDVGTKEYLHIYNNEKKWNGTDP